MYVLTSRSINLDVAAWTCTTLPCENCSPVARFPSMATYRLCALDPPAMETL